MTDRPDDVSEERRRSGRTGPLGDDDETRRAEDPEATRQVPAEEYRGARPRDGSGDRGGEETTAVGEPVSRPAGGVPPTRRDDAEDTADRETRVIRTPGAEEDTGSTPYPRGYFEAADERETRLREIYGGVQLLASFLGFVFAMNAAAVLAAIAALILVPLGFGLDLSGALTAATITGLVIVGLVVFLTYMFGGYVAGRLARFDGGRNGAMLLAWTAVAALVFFILSGVLNGLLPAGVSGALEDFTQETVLPAIGSLFNAGAVGIGVAVGAVLLALLGAVFGGKLGSRYHTEIDRTT